MITIDDFSKIEIKVGTVQDAVEVEGSEKLIKLTVDLGEEDPRTILTGVKQWYQPDFFKDKQFFFLSNLEPKKMMGVESCGMIMAVDSEDGPVFLTVDKNLTPGSKIR